MRLFAHELHFYCFCLLVKNQNKNKSAKQKQKKKCIPAVIWFEGTIAIRVTVLRELKTEQDCMKLSFFF